MSGSTDVLQWHDPQVETSSLSDRGAVDGRAIHDPSEHPAEDLSVLSQTRTLSSSGTGRPVCELAVRFQNWKTKFATQP